MVNPLMNSQIYYPHKIEIANSRNMKIRNLTKRRVPNPNPWLEISYQQSFKNSKTRPLIEKEYSAFSALGRRRNYL